MKYYNSIFMMLLSSVLLLARPTYALDVTVVDGQSRTNATVSQLSSRVDALERYLQINSDLLANVNRCGQNGELYDANANGGAGGCVSAAAGLASTLGCAPGETLVTDAGGQLVCKARMADCQLCTDYQVYEDTHTAGISAMQFATAGETVTLGNCHNLSKTSVLQTSGTQCAPLNTTATQVISPPVTPGTAVTANLDRIFINPLTFNSGAAARQAKDECTKLGYRTDSRFGRSYVDKTRKETRTEISNTRLTCN